MSYTFPNSIEADARAGAPYERLLHDSADASWEPLYARYTPPIFSNISFNFSSKGYTKPDFNNIAFAFVREVVVSSPLSTSNLQASIRAVTTDSSLLPVYVKPIQVGTSQLPAAIRLKFEGTAQLQALIEITKLYQDTTHTYTKECRTIVTGYSSVGIQTLKLPCLYGGIRDLGAYVKPQLTSFDLIANIAALTNYADLNTFQRAAVRDQSDFYTFNRAIRPSSFNLSALVRQTNRQFKDLSLYIKFVKGHQISRDLGAYLQDIQPANLPGYANFIEIRNISSYIEGVYYKGHEDLTVEFSKVLWRTYYDLRTTLSGWALYDLSARITSFSYKDLIANINAGFFVIQKDLISLINCVTPVDLSVSLQGYAKFDLNAFTIIGYQTNDLQAYVGASTPVDIQAKVNAVLGSAVSFDLTGYIHGVYKKDLMAYIGVNAAKDLKAYIDAIGKYLDLEARISPRTINIKRMLLIPLFEHKDLRATIQYSCKSSGFTDFKGSIYAIRKLDLRAHIIGWFGGTTDNLKDLTAHINVGSFTVQNYITVQGSTSNKYTNTTTISATTEKLKYKTFNTSGVLGGSKNDFLSANIIGVLNSLNLSAFVSVKPIANFTTLPSWIDPKTQEVVINIKRFEERWRRFVDLMFFTNSEEDYHYFYVSGEDKVYKVDKNRTWKIQITGYQEDTDTIYDRVKTNKKFIFNLDSYDTVDEAVRDLIDRVTLYRSLDLSVSINAYDLDYHTLEAHVKVINRTKWSKSLIAAIKCFTGQEAYLSASIQPRFMTTANNLTANIVGKAYEPPPANNVNLVFEDSGYTPTNNFQNMNWTYKQAEKFWTYYEE